MAFFRAYLVIILKTLNLPNKLGWFFNIVGKLNYMCVPIKARVELSSQMHSLMLSINMRSRIANQHHFATVLILAAKLVFVDYKSKNK